MLKDGVKICQLLFNFLCFIIIEKNIFMSHSKHDLTLTCLPCSYHSASGKKNRKTIIVICEHKKMHNMKINYPKESNEK